MGSSQYLRIYDNEEAKKGGRAYKRQFADLPTVDHVDDGLGAPNFVICSWQTNDSKSDLTHDELLDFCRAILDHHASSARRDDTRREE